MDSSSNLKKPVAKKSNDSSRQTIKHTDITDSRVHCDRICGQGRHKLSLFFRGRLLDPNKQHTVTALGQ